MARIIVNSFRSTVNRFQKDGNEVVSSILGEQPHTLPKNAKLLAWAIFLMFFIENGTLGIFPERSYFVYRNVRISDLIMYCLIVYSLFCVNEYISLFNSKSLIIVKLLLAYLVLVFIGSAFVYKYNFVEFFFRLKSLWASFLIFPYLLLFKRKALPYLIKIIFPFAVLSNILYILSSVTGTAYLPDITIIKQTIPGGFKIYRVYGGTFYGELYFLGYIYFWITKKFRPHQLFIVILFIIPHILAFGRGTWLYFIFTIAVMFFWNTLKNKNFKTVIKQVVLAAVLFITVFYALTRLIPESSYITGALESRIQQGQEDYKYKEGTIGTRLENSRALIDLWLNSNVVVGIGMHPMWVIAPVTERESIYYWGFSDLIGPGVLAAYGLIGLILVSMFQIYYGFTSFKILKRAVVKDIYILLVILFLCRIIFVTFSYNILLIGLWGPSFTISFYIAVVAYKYEHLTD